MENKKVIQTLFGGLGGHGNVAFSLLSTSFSSKYQNKLVFYGVDDILDDYIKTADQLTIKTYSILKKPKHYITAINKFYKILCSEKPDCIIIHNSELILAAAKYKKSNSTKVIFVEHENLITKSFKDRLISKIALKKADYVICLNQDYKNQLNKSNKYDSKIIVIPNGIDEAIYFKDRSYETVNSIGMAARFVSSKDYKSLLFTFSKLKDKFPHLRLKLAGSGEGENSLKQYAKDLKINQSVDFLGLLNATEMVEFYHSIDLYFHATLGETMSTSILQAMASALPIITSDISNNKLLIKQHSSGLLYQNKNRKDMLEKAVELIGDSSLRCTIGENARKSLMTNYTKDIMSDKYQKLIDK